MKTELLDGGSRQSIEKAAEILKNGGLVAIPTETVYGLAANAFDKEAVVKIFKAKGRPVDNPLIVHICRFEELYKLVKSVPQKAKELAEKYWPGPLTIILPKADTVPDEVSPGLTTVAVRFPSHPVARAIIDAAGVPLAAPSANSSGLPSPTTAKHVMDDMNGKIEAVVDGGACDVGIESTVVTLAAEVPRLLRPGGITLEQLEAVLGHVEVDPAVLSELKEGDTDGLVLELQYILAVIAFFDDQIPIPPVNGVFDERTKETLMAFQRQYGLEPTGVLNQPTLNQLLAVYRDTRANVPQSVLPDNSLIYPGRYLLQGARGDDVTDLQNLLNRAAETHSFIPKVTVDGVFGPSTEAAVRAVQQHENFDVNGIVGPLLWNRIADLAKGIV